MITHRKVSSAFTLVELLVVIAIIGGLIALLLWKFVKVASTARCRPAVGNLPLVKLAVPCTLF